MKKKKREKLKDIQKKEPFLQKFSLRTRLLIIFLTVIVISTGLIGLISYHQAKELIIVTNENRLKREIKVVKEMAEYLKLSYISDEERFNKQFEYGVRGQAVELIQEGLNGDFFTIDDTGTVSPFNVSRHTTIVFPEQVIEEILDQGNGLIYTTINDFEYALAFDFVQDIRKTVIIVVPSNNYLHKIYQLGRFIQYAVVVSIMVGSIIIFFVVRTITLPLTALRAVMRKVRTGDLSQSLNHKTTTPEIVSLIKSYNQMIEQMNTMIDGVKKTTDRLFQRSSDLDHSSNIVQDTNSQLLEAIRVVGQGAEQTAVSSDENTMTFQKMKQNITHAIQQVEVVNISSKEMNDHAQIGKQQIGDMLLSMEELHGEFIAIHETISKVKEESQEISGIVELIKQISEQTKLLALNATIEAARAGEAGKGFAIVATEVRRLAEQATTATVKITKAIQSMNFTSENAANEFNSILQKVDKHTDVAHHSNEVFHFLLTKILDTNVKLNEMKQGLASLGEVLPDMEKASVSFTSISQETLASTEEMTAISNQQLLQSKENYTISKELYQTSKSLQELTSGFQVKKNKEK
ncbi:methyl-accepting chemotaxis protein [Alkalihalobacterium alkalinitrilicum]|uniref:methyl-accepting chemotaxis protein n=1 Tax=Alkalihalobacterium alkalinitrilicum TaxID=427920 RepID=UPI0009953DDF|nr:methyl-accepting chemotaxis protein [Alkalihalobacterium alkalinitrilicum]